MLVKLELYVTAPHLVPDDGKLLLYFTHSSMQSSKVYTVVRTRSFIGPEPSAASTPFGQSVKQYSVKLESPEAWYVLGAVKVQLFAARPWVPDVTKTAEAEVVRVLVEDCAEGPDVFVCDSAVE
jgi:hypothetical protein